VIGNAEVGSDGTAVFSTTTLPKADDVVSAAYNGDSNYSDSTSAPVAVTVNLPITGSAASTTTFVFPIPNSVLAGGTGDLEATVASTSPGGPTPTGTVSFLVNGNVIGGAEVFDGTAEYLATGITVGTDSLTARYNGDDAYASSTSAPLIVSVPLSSSSTILSASSDVAVSGDMVTFTATVASVPAGQATPTGTVTFRENGATLLGAAAVVDNGLATLPTSSLVLGTDIITAIYSGDGNFAASTSSPLSVTVFASPTAVTQLQVSAGLLAAAGDPITFTATVFPVSPGGATPTGTVTFVVNGTSLGTGELQSDDIAVLATSSLPVGSNSVVATYSGDSTYTASKSNPVTVNVNGVGLMPTIMTSTLPPALVAGSAVEGVLKVNVTNPTATQIVGPSTINIYASADGVVDDSATLIASSTLGLDVQPGKTETVKIPTKSSPSSLPDGAYTLLARLNNPSSSADFSITGPSIQVGAPFVALSEILTSTLPATLVSGTKAKGTVKLVITNNGNVPSKGITAIVLTLSAVSGQLGTPFATLSKNMTILPGKSVSVTVPVKSTPALVDGNYFVVAHVTDPFDAGTIDIAAPFVALVAALGPVSNVNSGDTLTITNNGNIEDNSKFTGTLGFSLDSAGAHSIGSTIAVTTGTLQIKAGKSVKVHLSAWKLNLSGPVSGVPYYLTASLTDATGDSASALSSTSFTL
jgi:hypothetical protein